MPLQLLILLLFVMLPMITTQSPPSLPATTILPQCQCSAIDECSRKMQTRMDGCKVEPQCEGFLHQIGNATAIRACLDAEQVQLEQLEQCVKNKVGQLGCTNDRLPQNLTVPIMPPVHDDSATIAPVPSSDAVGMSAAPPPQLGHYLICVDQCGMVDDDGNSRHRRSSPLNCAFKLRCALAPPDERVQDAFKQCEQSLAIDPKRRFADSCRCMKSAGVTIDCTQ